MQTESAGYGSSIALTRVHTGVLSWYSRGSSIIPSLVSIPLLCYIGNPSRTGIHGLLGIRVERTSASTRNVYVYKFSCRNENEVFKKHQVLFNFFIWTNSSVCTLFKLNGHYFVYFSQNNFISCSVRVNVSARTRITFFQARSSHKLLWFKVTATDFPLSRKETLSVESRSRVQTKNSVDPPHCARFPSLK